MKTYLHLNALEILIHLGWEEAERRVPQRVMFEVRLQFDTPPQGMHSDDLADTVCYARLETALREQFTLKSYKLLEHVGYHAHQVILKWLPPHLQCTLLRVTKFLEAPHGSRSFEMA